MLALRVLGNTDRYLAPFTAGTGYLLEGGGARVLMDCGQGIASALRDEDPGSIDAIVVSHFHFDHAGDLAPIRNAVREGTTLFVPPGTRGNLAAIARAFAFKGAFDPPGPLVEARPGDVHTVGKLRLDFLPTRHSTPGIATRARATGRAVVYTSDTAPTPELADFARKADLVLAHALIPTVDPASDHARRHMTAETAGELARAAGAHRLLLSHRYWESQDVEMREAAAKAFAGVELAETGGIYEVR